MKGAEMFDAIAHIDEKHVERYLEKKRTRAIEKAGALSEESARAPRWKSALPYAALAAGFVLVLGLLAILHIGDERPNIDPITGDPTAAPTATPEPTEEPTEDPEAAIDIEFKGFKVIVEIPARELHYGETETEEGTIGYLTDPAMNIGPAQIEAVSDDEFMVLDQVNRRLIFAKLDGSIRTVSLKMCDRPKAAAYENGRIAILDSESIVIVNENGGVESIVALPEEQHNDDWNYGGVGQFEYVNGRLYWQTNSDKTYVLEGNELKETAQLRSVSITNGRATVGENGRVWEVPVGSSPITPVKTQNDALLALTAGGELPEILLKAELCYADNGPFAEANIEEDGYICTPLFTMSPTERVYMLTCHEDQAVIWELIFGPNEEAAVTVPEGYDENDYTVLRAFFETADAGGVMNGEKLFTNYDPADPTTWIDEDPYRYNSVTWNAQGRVSSLAFTGTAEAPIELNGKLDLNRLDAVEGAFTWMTAFDEIAADDLPVTSKQNNACFQFPMVNGEARFTGGYVERLYLLSATHMFCDITGEASSQLSVLPSFKIDVTVEGLGYAGVSSYGDENYYEVHLNATPAKGGSFIGWFDAEGNLVSSDENYTLYGEDSGVDAEGAHGVHTFTARFKTSFDPEEAAKLVSFFELADENGVKNGEKLFYNYDPADPSTWISSSSSDTPAWSSSFSGNTPSVVCDEAGHVQYINFIPTESAISVDPKGGTIPVRLAGELQLIGFPELISLTCDGLELEDLTIKNCPKLWMVIVPDAVQSTVRIESDTLYQADLLCRGAIICDYRLSSVSEKMTMYLTVNSGNGAVMFKCNMYQFQPKLLIEAVPDAGWSFVKWTDERTDAYLDAQMDLTHEPPTGENEYCFEAIFAETEDPVPMYEGDAPEASDLYVKAEPNNSVEIDLDFDGKPDTVTLEQRPEMDNEDIVRIKLGSQPGEEYEYSFIFTANSTLRIIDCDANDGRLDIIYYFANEEGGSGLYAFRVNAAGDGVDEFRAHAQFAYKPYPYGDPSQIDEASEFDPKEGIPVRLLTDLMDTQYITSRATVTAEGFRYLEPFSYPDPQTYSLAFHELKRDMNAIKVQTAAVEEAVTIKAGTKVAPVETDHWTYLVLITEDGELIKVDLVTRGYTFLINGAHQEEYFDIWYAG